MSWRSSAIAISCRCSLRSSIRNSNRARWRSSKTTPRALIISRLSRVCPHRPCSLATCHTKLQASFSRSRRLARQGVPSVLMVQKEVGDRLVAAPNTENYGQLSVFAQAACSVQRLFVLSPNCFHPRPSIDSVVMQFSAWQSARGGIKNLRASRASRVRCASKNAQKRAIAAAFERGNPRARSGDQHPIRAPRGNPLRRRIRDPRLRDRLQN